MALCPLLSRSDDGNGGRRRERREREVWRHLLTEERYVDFYIQDGMSKVRSSYGWLPEATTSSLTSGPVAQVFINGSNRGQCKVQSRVDAGGGASIFNQPPPGEEGEEWGARCAGLPRSHLSPTPAAGIQQLIGARMTAGAIQNFMGWGGGNGRTGRYRYREVSRCCIGAVEGSRREPRRCKVQFPGPSPRAVLI